MQPPQRENPFAAPRERVLEIASDPGGPPRYAYRLSGEEYRRSYRQYLRARPLWRKARVWLAGGLLATLLGLVGPTPWLALIAIPITLVYASGWPQSVSAWSRIARAIGPEGTRLATEFSADTLLFRGERGEMTLPLSRVASLQRRDRAAWLWLDSEAVAFLPRVDVVEGSFESLVSAIEEALERGASGALDPIPDHAVRVQADWLPLHLATLHSLLAAVRFHPIYWVTFPIWPLVYGLLAVRLWSTRRRIARFDPTRTTLFAVWDGHLHIRGGVDELAYPLAEITSVFDGRVIWLRLEAQNLTYILGRAYVTAGDPDALLEALSEASLAS